MAIAVIGGLITSTVLSLVVPAVHTYVDDAEGRLKRLRAKRPEHAERKRMALASGGIPREVASINP